jgi:spermidine synthase
MGLRHQLQRLIPHGLMLASGFAGLGYQIVWTQQAALWLGHEAAAVLAVVAAFFGGLALGAFTFGPRIERSARPVWWYGLCELVIAAWGLLLVFAMPAASGGLLRLMGAQPAPAWQWTVAFCGTFLLLLPATAAMGATLPAMERVRATLHRAGRSIAGIYASNTLGAVLGVLATAFWLVPGLGLAKTAALCVVLNLLCAIAAFVAWSRHPTTRPAEAPPPANATARAVLLRLACTGLLGIGYEVLVVRVLSQVAQDTVYTFAMLLAVYLVGTALGAAAYQRWFAGTRHSVAAGDLLLCALGAACLLGTASLWAAESTLLLSLAAFGAGMPAAIAAEAAMGLLAFALPTLVMGALFSHLSAEARAAGVSFGRALSINTLGAAAAPLIFGVLAFPLLGPKFALLLVGAGYLALAGPRAWRRPVLLLPAAAAALLAVLAPRLAFIQVPDGGRIVSYREGVMAAVSVVEDAQGVASLRIDNRQQEGSSATLRVDGRQGLLPVLLHPAPRHALFLGVGTGITASFAAQEPQLQVDAVELLPEVIAAAGYFTAALDERGANPRLHFIAADARRYVRGTAASYDVIVADNFHPARSGAGSLYTVEHFTAVRERLAPGGVFCQWLPLHQLDLATLRSIVRAFVAVYPQGWAMLASNSLETPVLGLVARREPGARLDAAQLRRHVSDPALAGLPGGIGIEDEFALLGGFIAGPAALARFAADAPANTDDHPVVAYRAPRITYAPDSLPRDRLLALLQEVSIAPAELIDPASGPEFAARLGSYWRARDQFIATGLAIRPSADVQTMLAQLRAPLLAMLTTSPEFRPAYDPLLRMALALRATDPAAAQSLLLELVQRQPARPEARDALQPAVPSGHQTVTTP